MLIAHDFLLSACNEQLESNFEVQSVTHLTYSKLDYLFLKVTDFIILRGVKQYPASVLSNRTNIDFRPKCKQISGISYKSLNTHFACLLGVFICTEIKP